MSHLPNASQPLPERTLRALHELVLGRGLDLSKELDISELARRSSLTPQQARALLDGKSVREPRTVEEHVTKRISQTFRIYVEADEKNEATVRKNLAAALGCSDRWATDLCCGRKMPNVPTLLGLERFFGVSRGFFGMTAAEALDLALAPELDRLRRRAEPKPSEPPATASDTLEDLLQRFRGLDENEQLRVLMQQFKVDPDAIAFRGTKPSPNQMAALLILALKDDQ
ncbi:hypothetical protein ACIPSA_45520 [Streptomyces sp. NPDC086549]|uniref:hypothetical protein n=1 Tax=Streptomyces sp. NPDC086549 TaxID=3365752 RepID=UPI0038064C57